MQDPILPQFLCPHVMSSDDDFHVWFTGHEREVNWVCEACSKAYPTPPEAWIPATPEQVKWIQDELGWYGTCGRPRILERPANLRFEHTHLPIAGILDIQPDRNDAEGWIALLTDCKLIWLNSARQTVRRTLDLPEMGFELNAETGFHVSPKGDFVAIYQVSGSSGCLIGMHDGAIVRHLSRGTYRPGNSCFPLVFWTLGSSTHLVMGTNWDRLDILNCETNQLVTERTFQPCERGVRRAHDLDYFHGSLAISPDGRYIADSGWIWHPVGTIRVWELPAWLENEWESEDGPTVRSLLWRNSFWDGPMVWTDDHTFAAWGYGRDKEWLLPAIMRVNLRDGTETWFPGPEVRQPVAWPPRSLAQSLFYDGYLYAVSEQAGTTVWDLQTGERLHADPTAKPWRQHPLSKAFVEVTPEGLRFSRLT